MARRLKKLGKPTDEYKEQLNNVIAEVKSESGGKGAEILTLVSPTLCLPVYLSDLLIRTFDISAPAIPEAAELFTIEDTVEENEGAQQTRNTRKKKSRTKTTDRTKVSYNHYKFPTAGLATQPTRTRGGAQQKIHFVSGRFPRLLTTDCICWFMKNAFDENKIPAHFINAENNARTDFVTIPTDELAEFTV